jgi:Trypsin-like peptidase domain
MQYQLVLHHGRKNLTLKHFLAGLKYKCICRNPRCDALRALSMQCLPADHPWRRGTEGCHPIEFLVYLEDRTYVGIGHGLWRRCARLLQYLMTNYHEIESAYRHIIDVKPELDVAVLHIISMQDGRSTASNDQPRATTTVLLLTFGSSSKLLVGQSLVAIGNPFGLDATVTTGVESALNRVANHHTHGHLQLHSNRLRHQSGHSGGPLLNLDGTVVGVTTAIVTTSGSSAIPSDAMAPVVQAMIRRQVAQQKISVVGVSPTRLARSVHLETTVRLSQLGGDRVSQLSCRSSWAAAFAHWHCVVVVGSRRLGQCDHGVWRRHCGRGRRSHGQLYRSTGLLGPVRRGGTIGIDTAQWRDTATARRVPYP